MVASIFEENEMKLKREREAEEQSLQGIILKINRKVKGYEAEFALLVQTDNESHILDHRWLQCLRKNDSLLCCCDSLTGLLHKIHITKDLAVAHELKALLLSAFSQSSCKLQNEMLVLLHGSADASLRLEFDQTELESHLVVVLNQLVHQADLNSVVGQVAALALQNPSITLCHLVSAAVHNKSQTQVVVRVLTELSALPVLPSMDEKSSSLLTSILVTHLRQQQLTNAQQQNFCDLCVLLLKSDGLAHPLLPYSQLLTCVVSVGPPFNVKKLLPHLTLSLNLRILLVSIETMATQCSAQTKVVSECNPIAIANLLCQGLDWCDQSLQQLSRHGSEKSSGDNMSPAVEHMTQFSELTVIKKSLLKSVSALDKVLHLQNVPEIDYLWLQHKLQDCDWTTRLVAALLRPASHAPTSLCLPSCLAVFFPQPNIGGAFILNFTSYHPTHHPGCSMLALLNLAAISHITLELCTNNITPEAVVAVTRGNVYPSLVLAISQIAVQCTVDEYIRVAQFVSWLNHHSVLKHPPTRASPQHEIVVCHTLCDAAIVYVQSVEGRGDRAAHVAHVCQCLCSGIKEVCISRVVNSLNEERTQNEAPAAARRHVSTDRPLRQLATMYQCVTHVMSNFHQSTHEMLLILCLDILDLIHQCVSSEICDHPLQAHPDGNKMIPGTEKYEAMLNACSSNAIISEDIKDNMSKKLEQIFNRKL